MLDNAERHEMCLDKTYPSGAEEWYCPECGRRILLGIPPTSEMVIVEPGNKYASHWGSHDGLHIGAAQVTQPDAELGEISEENLLPWIKALEELELNEKDT